MQAGLYFTFLCYGMVWCQKDFGPLPIKNGKYVIKLGVILPAERSFPWSLGPTKQAINIARNSSMLREIIPKFTIEATFKDSQCSGTFATSYCVDMYLKKEVNVLFGPACDYAVAPIARLTQFWDLPMITAGALVKDFSNKDIYKLLTRIGGTYDKLAIFIRDLLYYFKWYTPGLIYEASTRGKNSLNSGHFIMESLSHLIETIDGKQIWSKHFETGYANSYDQVESLLKEASLNTRVVVLCASRESVREIMLKAHDLNFVNGEYVFFNIDLFSSKSESERPWYREGDTPERNRKAKQAYEAVMTVTLRKHDSYEYRMFSEEVKRRAEDEHKNVTYGEEEVNSFVGAFHDGVILYALALNKTLSEGGHATDGTAITRNMWNRTFQGITGTVSIDENGDRNTDYSLLDMNPDTGNFEVVGNYHGNKKVYEVAPYVKIHWPGGLTEPPPDVPKCGFNGSGCATKESFTISSSSSSCWAHCFLSCYLVHFSSTEPFPLYTIAIIVLGLLLLIELYAAFFERLRSTTSACTEAGGICTDQNGGVTVASWSIHGLSVLINASTSEVSNQFHEV